MSINIPNITSDKTNNGVTSHHEEELKKKKRKKKINNQKHLKQNFFLRYCCSANSIFGVRQKNQCTKKQNQQNEPEQEIQHEGSENKK